MVDENSVRLWLKEVEDRIRINAAELERLQAIVNADKRREAALKTLLGADAKEIVGALEEPPDTAQRDTQPAAPGRHPIEQGALQILRERGSPTHVADLRAELIRQRIPIPGRGTDANVIVYLARSSEICRVGRGLYALKEWGVPAVPSRRRRSTRRKRRARAHNSVK